MTSVYPEYVVCRRPRVAPLALILTSLGLAMPAHALTLKAQTIKLEHPANGSVLRLQGQPVLLVSGHNHEFRWLSKVDYASGATEQIALPAQVQFFQQANLVGQAGSQLVALGQDAIWHYQFSDKKWRNLVQVPSAYPVTDAKRMLMLDFSVDLNQDGLSDFSCRIFARCMC
jgi:hypothetical protein